MVTPTLPDPSARIVNPHSPSSRHDAPQLVAAVRGQQTDAIARVLEALGPALRGFLTDVLGDADAVEDVTQQTLLEVWRRGPSYDPTRSSLLTWTLMIARSRAIDHLRRRVPEPFDPAGADELVDPATEHQIDAMIERWQVASLLRTLPRDEATILEMRFYRGLSQREIAARTGMPLGTVKTRMTTALGRLRTALERERAQ